MEASGWSQIRARSEAELVRYEEMDITTCVQAKRAAMGLIGLLLTATVAWAKDETKAYAISREPTQAVVAVKVSVPQSGLIRSMTLYGDSRLVLLRHGSGQQVFESYVLKLEPAEVDALLRIVVDHNLPDYDETDIMARQIRSHTGASLGGHIGADGEFVFVDIALASYTSHGRTRDGVFTKIQVEAAKSAANTYHDIQEFRGIQLLTEQLYAYWKRVGGTRW